MAMLDVDGVELFYERVGDGDRVVMTHGAWTDGRTWDEVKKRLAPRFEVITWDRRGHSRSDDGSPPGSTRQDAADLARLIDHLGGGPAHMVGNSAGGNVVLNLVAMRGDLVRCAAVHEPGPFGLVEATEDHSLRELIEREKLMTGHVEHLIAEAEHEEAARYFVDEIAVGSGAWEQFPEELRIVMTANAATVSDDLRDGWDADSVDLAALAASSVPMLVTTGSDSPRMETEAACELKRRLPAVRLETVEGAGHIPHRTHPDDYAAMLTAFLDTSASDVPVSGSRR